MEAGRATGNQDRRVHSSCMSPLPHFVLTFFRGTALCAAVAALLWLWLGGLPPQHLLILLPLVFGILMLLPWPRKTRWARGLWIAAICGLVALTYFAPGAFAEFRRDLYRIRPGMSEAEVRTIMGKHTEGDGRPGVFRAFTGGSHSRLITEEEAIIFRASPQEHDLGIVSFKGGRVTYVDLYIAGD